VVSQILAGNPWRFSALEIKLISVSTPGGPEEERHLDAERRVDSVGMLIRGVKDSIVMAWKEGSYCLATFVSLPAGLRKSRDSRQANRGKQNKHVCSV
jgi:hypothetical protein